MDIDPVYYRTVDPVQNLQVKVTVRRLKRGHGMAPAAGSGAPTPEPSTAEVDLPPAIDTGVPRSPSRGSVSRGSVFERQGPEVVAERTFMWQEKVFSPAELVKYGPTGDTVGKPGALSGTHADTEYRAEIMSRVATGQDLFGDVPSVALFSYVDQDGFVPPENLSRSIVAGSGAQRSELADSIVKLPMRVTNTLAAGSKPLSLVRREAPFRSMYIMAAVDIAKEDFRAKRVPALREIPLCVLRAYTNTNLLEMRPGFDDIDDSPEDAEEVDDDTAFTASRTRFTTAEGEEYEIVLSNPDQEEAFNQFLATERALESKALLDRRHRVGTEFFGAPPELAMKVFAFVEIVAATDFPDDQLFVEYALRLPAGSGWRWATDILGDRATRAGSGITHASRSVEREWEWDGEEARVTRVANFGYPVEVHLLHKEEHGGPVAWQPEVLLSVYSKDSWGIINVQGYGHFSLPSSPGCHNVTVKTWYPQGSIREQLGTFFLGGAANMTDLSHVSIPRDTVTTGPTKLNKFGFRTVSSGQVAIRANVVHQHQPRTGSKQVRKARAKSVAAILAEARAVRKLLAMSGKAKAKVAEHELEAAYAEVARARDGEVVSTPVAGAAQGGSGSGDVVSNMFSASEV